MGEKTVYFRDLNGLIVVCYERQEFDAFRDTIWQYNVVIKAQARIGTVIHYMLVHDIHQSKIKKTFQDLVAVIKAAVSTAMQRSGYFVSKLHEDSCKLQDFIKGDISYAT